MWIVNRATERPVTVLMFFVAVGLFGLVSLSRLNVNLLPDLSYPTLTVRTELLGAAPQEIENLLTKSVEEAVSIAKNVRQVRSVSRSGQSDVTIEFIWGTDMNLASVDVREKLDILQLPLEAKRPLLLRFDPSSEPVMRIALGKKSDAKPSLKTLSTIELKSLRLYAEDELKRGIESVSGVAAVKVSGGLEEEIQILVDQQKVSSLGLAVADIASKIRAENINLAGGQLEQGSQRYLVRTLNEFKTVEEISDAIVAVRDNKPVYLRDVAQVTRGFKEREAITRVNGSEAIDLGIYKEGDANTVQVAKRTRQRLEELAGTMPDEYELTTVYDQSTFISSAINQVVTAAASGAILAILVLYGFLRNARATFIIGLAIPVSIIGTFALMHLSNITLNIMSLGGIALAVGLLVDNSIVVLENIVRKKESGKNILDAAREGTSEVTTAVTAATLTTVAVFFPMVFVTGIAGQLFRDQALTVTFALLFSLILAIVLIPMLASAGARKKFAEATITDSDKPLGRFSRGLAFVVRGVGKLLGGLRRLSAFLLSPIVWLFQNFSSAMARAYAPLLRWSLSHRAMVIIAALLILVASASLVPRLGSELIPQLAQGEFSVNIRLPPGSPLDLTDEAVQKAYRAASLSTGVETTYSVSGTGNRLDANPTDSGENTGTLNVVLEDGARDQEARVMAEIRDSLQTEAGLAYDFARPALLSLSTPVEIVVTGYNLDDIESVSNRIFKAISTIDRFVDVRTTVESGSPEIQIVFDQERASGLGLAVRDIADQVVTNVRGDLATRYSWKDRKIDVLVRGLDNRNASLKDIQELIINPASDRPVRLSDVASVSASTGPAEIRRLDQERSAIISANLAYGDLATAAGIVQDLIDDIPKPTGLAIEVLGQNSDMQDSLRSMKFTLLLAVFLVYLVMASQFESLLHPFVILFTIPLALVGAILALFITGTTINVVAFIGVIMLTGIVVNNAIVLIDMINQLRRQGLAIYDAILEAGAARLRPILMTTLTTALGLLPMATGFGEGAEIRAPMAITVIGGLLTSTLLTLVVIPVVYSLLERERSIVGVMSADQVT